MKIKELFEARKPKFDLAAHTDEEGSFKSPTGFDPKTHEPYSKLYARVKKFMDDFVVDNMKAPEEVKTWLRSMMRETDDFHTDEFHGVTRSLQSYKDADYVYDHAFPGIEEIWDHIQDRFPTSKADGVDALIDDSTPMGRKLRDKLEKRSGDTVLRFDPESYETTRKFEKQMEKAFSEYFDYKYLLRKWNDTHKHNKLKAKDKDSMAKALTPEGLAAAVKAFDESFDESFGAKSLERVKEFPKTFEDWFGKGVVVKSDLLDAVYNGHGGGEQGRKDIIDWAQHKDPFYEFGRFALKSKKLRDYIFANSKHLTKYR